MKPITKYLVFVIILLAVAFGLPGRAMAAGPDESLPVKLVLGGNYTLESGEILRSSLFIMGGNVTLETDSLVTGDVLLLGGNLTASGEIRGNLSTLGGNVVLSSEAVVGGDVNQIGGVVEENDARIEGSINIPDQAPFLYGIPSIPRIPQISVNYNPFWGIISLLFRAFLLSALAMLVVMIWPKQTERVGQSIVSQPLAVGLAGFAAALVVIILGSIIAVVGGFLLFILLITICLSPLALLGGLFALLCGLFLFFVVLFGWASIGLEIGKRVAQMFHSEWAPPLAAGLGTFFLSLVASGWDTWFLLSCLSWVLGVIAGSLAIGGVIMTRFGTQPYPRVGLSAAPAEPAAPAPPLPPEGPGDAGGEAGELPSAPETGGEVNPSPAPRKSRKPKEPSE